MPTDLQSITDTVHRRQMSTPLLLLLASHQPLAFIAGQLLYALVPMGLLWGWESVTDWAALLSAPDATQRLAATLATAPATSSTKQNGHQAKQG